MRRTALFFCPLTKETEYLICLWLRKIGTGVLVSPKGEASICSIEGITDSSCPGTAEHHLSEGCSVVKKGGYAWPVPLNWYKETSQLTGRAWKKSLISLLFRGLPRCWGPGWAAWKSEMEQTARCFYYEDPSTYGPNPLALGHAGTLTCGRLPAGRRRCCPAAFMLLRLYHGRDRVRCPSASSAGGVRTPDPDQCGWGGESPLSSGERMPLPTSSRLTADSPGQRKASRCIRSDVFPHVPGGLAPAAAGTGTSLSLGGRIALRRAAIF